MDLTKRRPTRAILGFAAVAAAACTDRSVGASPKVPVAADYPSVASAFSVAGATASDSRVPVITVTGDSVVVTMVVPTICGRDTVMAGEARDSVVVTLRRTILPLPCAILLPDVQVRARVLGTSRPRFVIVSVHTLDFADTTRALVASEVVGSALATRQASAK